MQAVGKACFLPVKSAEELGTVEETPARLPGKLYIY
jgi:hypothetical protein